MNRSHTHTEVTIEGIVVWSGFEHASLAQKSTEIEEMLRGYGGVKGIQKFTAHVLAGLTAASARLKEASESVDKFTTIIAQIEKLKIKRKAR